MNTVLCPRPSLMQAYEAQFLNVLGGNVAFRVTVDDTGGAMSQFEYLAEPGHGVPVHVHDEEDEAFFVIDGAMRFTIEGVERLAAAGTSIFVPRGVSHGFTVVGDTPLRALVTLTPGKVEAMFRELSTLPRDPTDFTRVHDTCARHGVRFV